MANRWRVRRVVWALGVVSMLPAASVRAQSEPERAYVTGGPFVEIKRFSGNPSEGILDGNVGGGAIAIGSHIGSRWDVQVGVDMTGFSRTERPRSLTFQRETFTLTSIAENQVVSVSSLLRYRAAPHGRVRLGYLAGLSFVRLHRRFHTIASAGTPAGLIPRPDQNVDYSAAPTVGLDARIALSTRLSLVPGIHACVFGFGNDSGLLVRPRVGIRWTF